MLRWHLAPRANATRLIHMRVSERELTVLSQPASRIAWRRRHRSNLEDIKTAQNELEKKKKKKDFTSFTRKLAFDLVVQKKVAECQNP